MHAKEDAAPGQRTRHNATPRALSEAIDSETRAGQPTNLQYTKRTPRHRCVYALWCDLLAWAESWQSTPVLPQGESASRQAPACRGHNDVDDYNTDNEDGGHEDVSASVPAIPDQNRVFEQEQAEEVVEDSNFGDQGSQVEVSDNQGGGFEEQQPEEQTYEEVQLLPVQQQQQQPQQQQPQQQQPQQQQPQQQQQPLQQQPQQQQQQPAQQQQLQLQQQRQQAQP